MRIQSIKRNATGAKAMLIATVALVGSMFAQPLAYAAEDTKIKEMEGYNIEYYGSSEGHLFERAFITGITDVDEKGMVAIPNDIDGAKLFSIEKIYNEDINSLILDTELRQVNEDALDLAKDASIVFKSKRVDIDENSFVGDTNNLVFYSRENADLESLANKLGAKFYVPGEQKITFEAAENENGEFGVKFNYNTIYNDFEYDWTEKHTSNKDWKDYEGEDNIITPPEGEEGEIVLQVRALDAFGSHKWSSVTVNLDEGTVEGDVVSGGDEAEFDDGEESEEGEGKEEEDKEKDESDDVKKEEEKEKGEGETEEKEEEDRDGLIVPETSTNMFNFLLLSVGLLVTGLVGFIVTNRKKSEV